MTVGLAGLVFLIIVGALIALGVRAVRGRGKQDEDGGLDLIPYLILALAVGTAGFSLAALVRASLTPDRLIGRPTGEIAGALAGLVVAGPIAFLLWRRQARRRSQGRPARPAAHGRWLYRRRVLPPQERRRRRSRQPRRWPWRWCRRPWPLKARTLQSKALPSH